VSGWRVRGKGEVDLDLGSRIATGHGVTVGVASVRINYYSAPPEGTKIDSSLTFHLEREREREVCSAFPNPHDSSIVCYMRGI
jgi:hypothetical protein